MRTRRIKPRQKMMARNGYVHGARECGGATPIVIRKAGTKIKEEAGFNGAKLDTGFRVLTVDTSNMKDVYYQPDAVKQETLHGLVDNVKADRSDEDLLFQAGFPRHGSKEHLADACIGRSRVGTSSSAGCRPPSAVILAETFN